MPWKSGAPFGSFAGRVPGALIGVALLKLLSSAALDVLMSLMVDARRQGSSSAGGRSVEPRCGSLAPALLREPWRWCPRSAGLPLRCSIATTLARPCAPTLAWCSRSASASPSACAPRPGRLAGMRSPSGLPYCRRYGSVYARAVSLIPRVDGPRLRNIIVIGGGRRCADRCSSRGRTQLVK